MAEDRETSASKVLKSLNEFLEAPERDVTTMSREKVRARLDSAGIDTRPVVKRVRELLDEAAAAEKIVEAKRKDRLFSRLVNLYREKRETVPRNMKLLYRMKNTDYRVRKFLRQVIKFFKGCKTEDEI